MSEPELQPETTTESTGAQPHRPDTGWLDAIEAEIDDVDTVLKCLARDSATMCKTCDQIQSSSGLDARPILSRCASTKQPR